MKMTFQTVLSSWKNGLNFTFLVAGLFVFLFTNLANASEPKPWQMDLQEPAGIIATKATDLHDESYSLSFARGASGSGSEFLMDSPMYQKEMRTAASESMTATPNVVISEVSVVDE